MTTSYDSKVKHYASELTSTIATAPERVTGGILVMAASEAVSQVIVRLLTDTVVSKQKEATTEIKTLAFMALRWADKQSVTYRIAVRKGTEDDEAVVLDGEERRSVNECLLKSMDIIAEGHQLPFTGGGKLGGLRNGVTMSVSTYNGDPCISLSIRDSLMLELITVASSQMVTEMEAEDASNEGE